MSVFDAPAVSLHVDGDLNYVFTPREIALFTYVSGALRHVQETVEAEARSIRPSGNPFLVHFQRGTAIYPKIETVGATRISRNWRASPTTPLRARPGPRSSRAKLQL